MNVEALPVDNKPATWLQSRVATNKNPTGKKNEFSSWLQSRVTANKNANGKKNELKTMVAYPFPANPNPSYRLDHSGLHTVGSLWMIPTVQPYIT